MAGQRSSCVDLRRRQLGHARGRPQSPPLRECCDTHSDCQATTRVSQHSIHRRPIDRQRPCSRAKCLTSHATHPDRLPHQPTNPASKKSKPCFTSSLQSNQSSRKSIQERFFEESGRERVTREEPRNTPGEEKREGPKPGEKRLEVEAGERAEEWSL